MTSCHHRLTTYSAIHAQQIRRKLQDISQAFLQPEMSVHVEMARQPVRCQHSRRQKDAWPSRTARKEVRATLESMVYDASASSQTSTTAALQTVAVGSLFKQA
eukprot:scaffold1328_cov394-Prasinococcus_capsulatus_cf.AAC.31